MMFFEDTRSIGLIFWIVAVLMAINAVMLLAGAFLDDMVEIPDKVTDGRMFCLLTGAGSAASAIIYACNAHRTMAVRRSRLEVVRSYVRVIGLCTLIGGICGGLALYLYTDEPTLGFYVALVTIVISAIVLGIAGIIANGKKGPVKKVVWGILIVAFALMALEALTEADDYWEFAEHIAHMIIAVFMISFIADGDVRREMGVSE
jgi:hypothetical protein